MHISCLFATSRLQDMAINKLMQFSILFVKIKDLVFMLRIMCFETYLLQKWNKLTIKLLIVYDIHLA